MEMKVKGRVWKFQDNIDTDVISPAAYIDLPVNEMKVHALEAVNPKFPSEVKKGDVVLAGKNFGCGSSRETAAEVLKALGVGCVVAESFGRIFFRNCLAIGLPILICKGVTEHFEDGDPIEVDIGTAVLTNLATGKCYQADLLSEEMKTVLARGGVVSLLKELKREMTGS
ncbi:MAG TPA: 3-isopropylmalate dehydratase [Anaerolineaceae bacterium]|nr:3-isopropylmalate dehydratase [Anaerolineaceae bacterium]